MNLPVYMPIEHENRTVPDAGDTNSTTFSQASSCLRTPTEGMVNWLAQLKGAFASMMRRILVFGRILMTEGEYPRRSSVMRTSWVSSFDVSMGAVGAGLGAQSERSEYPLETLKSASAITTTPVNLKKFFAVSPLKNEVSHPTPKSPGAVQRAKKAMAIAPAMKLPVLTAYACMASVKPHGRKNVSAPVVMVARGVEASDPRFIPKNLGSVIETAPSRGERPVRLMPRSSMSKPTASVTKPTNRLENPSADQNAPRSPQKNQNQRTRPALKNTCGTKRDAALRLGFFAFHLALMPRTSPPTRAMQLDIQAVRPMRNATEAVGAERFPISQNENPKWFAR